jgi:hypothetical protein
LDYADSFVQNKKCVKKLSKLRVAKNRCPI